MFLWIGMGLAIFAGIIAPLGHRFQSTSLWAGRALWNPELGSIQPRGYQDAISDGWPSYLGLLALLPFISAGLAFLHSWWAGILAFVISLIVTKLVGQSKIIPKAVDWYLFKLLSHIHRREADYSVKGDAMRLEAIEQLRLKIEVLCTIYLNTDVPAPDMKTAKETPWGDYEYLLNIFKS